MSYLSKKVADSELKILQILWQKDREMTMPEIRQKLLPLTEWNPIMVKTLLYRLVDKGVVSSKKREMFNYKPMITEHEYNEYATNAFVEKLFDGNAKHLVASLISSQRLSQKDVGELWELLMEGERDD